MCFPIIYSSIGVWPGGFFLHTSFFIQRFYQPLLHRPSVIWYTMFVLHGHPEFQAFPRFGHHGMRATSIYTNDKREMSGFGWKEGWIEESYERWRGTKTLDNLMDGYGFSHFFANMRTIYLEMEGASFVSWDQIRSVVCESLVEIVNTAFRQLG